MKMKSSKYPGFFSSAPLLTSVVLFIAKALSVVSGKDNIIKEDRGRVRRAVRVRGAEVGTEGSESPNSRCGFVTGENPRI